MEDSSYEYHCGDNLFSMEEYEFIHPASTDIFYVKRALLSSMEIERLYYQAKNTIIFPPIYSNCRMNNEFFN